MVVLAGSAGGIKALSHILSALPADFPVPLAIVQHRTAQRPWVLHEILSHKTGLKVKYAAQGELIRAGTVYIAPPDQHLRVEAGHLFSLTDDKKIRHVRSSANPLFSSAAEAFKEKVIAVVLTGGDADATDEVQSVKDAGGIVIAQDKSTSEFFGMPKSAIETGCVDYVLPVEKISPAIVKLVKTGRYHVNNRNSVISEPVRSERG